MVKKTDRGSAGRALMALATAVADKNYRDADSRKSMASAPMPSVSWRRAKDVYIPSSPEARRFSLQGLDFGSCGTLGRRDQPGPEPSKIMTSTFSAYDRKAPLPGILSPSHLQAVLSPAKMH
jgi:hypothetical protein